MLRIFTKEILHNIYEPYRLKSALTLATDIAQIPQAFTARQWVAENRHEVPISKRLDWYLSCGRKRSTNKPTYPKTQC